MPATKATYKVADHFVKSEPAVRSTYAAILRTARSFGPVKEDPKKTSIHLVRTTAFAGIATRKSGLTLTLKAEQRIASPRVHRAEQASVNRWHLDVRLADPAEVDGELQGWIRQAYELA
jgi:hypothetical protein